MAALQNGEENAEEKAKPLDEELAMKKHQEEACGELAMKKQQEEAWRNFRMKKQQEDEETKTCWSSKSYEQNQKADQKAMAIQLKMQRFRVKKLFIKRQCPDI